MTQVYRSLSITELSELLRRRQVSPVELTKDALERASQLNAGSNYFITIDEEGALRQAQRSEQEIVEGRYRGPLHGVPVSLKDNIDTAGLRTTAGSAILKDRMPTSDSVVAKSMRDCGAVVLGKTNMHEFAYGITSQNPHYGTVGNPWAPGRIAGGSSGGSAASLAASVGYASVGTDTGGSIRIPASFCGVVGLKPTFDRVSVAGTIPLVKPFDHVGPIGRRVDDVACMFAALTARAALIAQPTDTRADPPDSLKGVRIGWPSGFYFELLDGEVRALLNAAATSLVSLGAEIREVTLEHLSEAVQAVTQLHFAEAYGWHHAQGYFPERAQEYGEDVRRLLEMGSGISAEDLGGVPAAREKLCASFDGAFESVDALLVPATPSAAPQIGATELVLAGRTESLRTAIMRLSRPTNFTGHPSLAVPCGFTAAGLPVAMQLIGPRDGEEYLLSIARKYEAANQWYLRRPPQTG